MNTYGRNICHLKLLHQVFNYKVTSDVKCIREMGKRKWVSLISLRIVSCPEVHSLNLRMHQSNQSNSEYV